MTEKTIIDKIWEKHVVTSTNDGPDILYIDKHFVHEVTSPQAFAGLERRNIKVFRPERTIATADHNVPTRNQHLPIKEELSRLQVEKLIENCKKYGIELFGLMHPFQGIVHVIGPELGFTQPGMTIVCGDSHTSTHGAFGAIAFGVGTSEVEEVLATQCLLQNKPRTMKIQIDGKLGKGVLSKDIILYVISKLTTGGGSGHFVEFTGSAIKELSMEARMTICNMGIEMGAKGSLIAPDEITFEYVKNKKFAPKGAKFEKAVEYWKTLKSDDNAVFDKEHFFNASEIEPMLTFGTNPGMAIKINEPIPTADKFKDKTSFRKAIEYMGFKEGEKLTGKKINYIFIGSCTNGRIEDIRIAAGLVKGRKKADNVRAMVVPGSMQVMEQAKKEGLDKIITDAGIDFREPGCSACLAMNEDKVPSGEYCIATSNRNFEGRQGPGARTILASPLTAAAAAIKGEITDPRELLI